MKREQYIDDSVILNAGLAALLHRRMPNMDPDGLQAWITANVAENLDKTKALVAFATGKVSKVALEIALEDEELLSSVVSLADEDAYRTVLEAGQVLINLLPDARKRCEQYFGEKYDNEHARETEC